MRKKNLVWKINWDAQALKDFKKLDKTIQKKILKFLQTKIAPQKNPRVFGKPLLHNKSGLWRYRLEDFRIICQIKESELMILVIHTGHRKNVYDKSVMVHF